MKVHGGRTGASSPTNFQRKYKTKKKKKKLVCVPRISIDRGTISTCKRAASPVSGLNIAECFA
jgi:hypothetical protein